MIGISLGLFYWNRGLQMELNVSLGYGSCGCHLLRFLLFDWLILNGERHRKFRLRRACLVGEGFT